MAFDISTAKPARSVGFDISTAEPDIDPNILALAQQRNPSLIPAAEAPQGGIVSSVLEPALSIASGAIAEPIAGALGTVGALIPGLDPGTGAETVESVREGLTFQPRTQAGQASQRAIGEGVLGALDAVNQFGREIGVPETLLQPIGDVAFEATDSPTVGAIASAVPTAIFEILGLKGIQKLRSGTRLINPDGTPTKQLEKVLDKQGLVFENLAPGAKAAIPEVADKRLIPGASEKAGAGELAVIEQIKSGATDDALAPLKVINNRIAPDDLGKEAVRQGFDPGFVQSVKVSNDPTRARMGQMLNMMQRITKNRRLGLDFRPTNVVGDAMTDRIKHIRDKVNNASIELNKIAKTELKGVELPLEPVIQRFESLINNLDIKLSDGPGGKPKPTFEGSVISKDKSSQKAVNDLIDLMAEGGKPDALRFHKLKRQLDSLIDFRKKSKTGLSKEGRDALKAMRAQLNDTLREANPKYAEVNDTISTGLGALDRFQNVAGKSIDIFGEGSNAAIGQDLRGLMSNRKSRVELENSINQIDNVAKQFGGNFQDDVKQLSLFANRIEDKFGTVAETSLKGEVESGVGQAVQQGPRAAAVQKAGEALGRGTEKLRGINEFNAFQAMFDLIKRGQ